MSKYTTEVRFICESYAENTESSGFDDIDSIIEDAAPLVFSFDFPIFDETYRLPLEIKILRNFYTREICEETVGLWKLRLSQKLNEIMPYYNKLYLSETINFNPLYDVDYTIEKDGSLTGTENSTGHFSSNSVGQDTLTHDTTNETTYNSDDTLQHGKTTTKTLDGKEKNTETRSLTEFNQYSDTPQGGLTGIIHDGTLAYLTDVRNIKHDDSVVNEIEYSPINPSTGLPETRTDVFADTGTDTNRHRGTDTKELTGTETRDLTGSESGISGGSKNIKNINEYTEHVSGKRGSVTYSKMIMEYRESLLNIDAMILRDLQPLFFGLWE